MERDLGPHPSVSILSSLYICGNLKDLFSLLGFPNPQSRDLEQLGGHCLQMSGPDRSPQPGAGPPQPPGPCSASQPSLENRKDSMAQIPVVVLLPPLLQSLPSSPLPTFQSAGEGQAPATSLSCLWAEPPLEGLTPKPLCLTLVPTAFSLPTDTALSPPRPSSRV